MSKSHNLTELRKLLTDVRRPLFDAVREGQAVLEQGLRARCPVGATRRLLASIRATAVKAGRRSVGGGVIVGTDHAIPVEFGHAHAPPHPFVRPTAAIDGPKAEAAMVRHLRRSLGNG